MAGFGVYQAPGPFGSREALSSTIITKPQEAIRRTERNHLPDKNETPVSKKTLGLCCAKTLIPLPGVPSPYS
jgi:hypothetical protein